MKLFWTETARQDLKAIKQYIAIDNPTAAKRWIEKLRKRTKNVLHAPFSGRKVPEFSRDDLRELIEAGGRRSEVGDRRSEVGDRKSEVGSRRSEVGG